MLAALKRAMCLCSRNARSSRWCDLATLLAGRVERQMSEAACSLR